VFSAISASAFLSIPFAAASSAAVTLLIQEGREASERAPAATPADFKKSRREVVMAEPRSDLELKDGDDLTRDGVKSQQLAAKGTRSTK
jgi:hypothetical protein